MTNDFAPLKIVQKTQILITTQKFENLCNILYKTIDIDLYITNDEKIAHKLTFLCYTTYIAQFILPSQIITLSLQE